MTKFYLIILALLLSVSTSFADEQKLTYKQAKEIAKEAYIYGFPLILNYKTMYNYAIDKNSPEYKGDFNSLGCTSRVYTPQDKAIVTPNSDTPYCMIWGDLRAEPLVFTIPKIEKERFYEVQLIDLYTHNYAYISTISEGNIPGKYLITAPDWDGEVPEGITKVISTETQFMFAIYRTQLMNPKDINNVKKIQDGYGVKSLSNYTKQKTPKSAPKLNFPKWREGTQFNGEGLEYLDFMLTLVDTPKEEEELIQKFAKLHIGTDDTFNINSFTPEIQKAIVDGVKEGFSEIEVFAQKASLDQLSSTKIFGTREFLNKSAQENYQLNNFFIMRAVAAHQGLYGNSGDEAIYPTYLVDADGAVFDASKNSYTLTFEKGEFPPVKAFWSFTIYDGRTQLLIDNPIDRYLLNSSMMEQFSFEKDGSLTLYIQKDSPGKKLESNWLPAPDGPFYGVMRLYGPKKEAIEGKWSSPALLKTIKE